MRFITQVHLSRCINNFRHCTAVNSNVLWGKEKVCDNVRNWDQYNQLMQNVLEGSCMKPFLADFVPQQWRSICCGYLPSSSTVGLLFLCILHPVHLILQDLTCAWGVLYFYRLFPSTPLSGIYFWPHITYHFLSYLHFVTHSLLSHEFSSLSFSIYS